MAESMPKTYMKKVSTDPTQKRALLGRQPCCSLSGSYSFLLLRLVVNASLLFCARRAIRNGDLTPFSTSIRFLHKEYVPAFFWWELVEMTRRLVLVGVFVLPVFNRGSIVQVVLGTIFCSIFL